ncbi:hypothetical protein C8Q80DRAFT_1181121 [Daedaleopsis nitida]|nr:hypothetical protein C8Q80DRAFT_1181121 [Daedaleopsis nitida]
MIIWSSQGAPCIRAVYWLIFFLAGARNARVPIVPKTCHVYWLFAPLNSLSTISLIRATEPNVTLHVSFLQTQHSIKRRQGRIVGISGMTSDCTTPEMLVVRCQEFLSV